jgi:hypothetical protein
MAVRLAVFRSLDKVRPTRLSIFSDRIEVTRHYGRVARTRRIDYDALSSVKIVDARGSASVVMVDELGVVPVPLMGRSDAGRARVLIEGLRKPRS